MSGTKRLTYEAEFEPQTVITKKDRPSASAVSIFKQKPFARQVKMLNVK